MNVVDNIRQNKYKIYNILLDEFIARINSNIFKRGENKYEEKTSHAFNGHVTCIRKYYFSYGSRHL